MQTNIKNIISSKNEELNYRYDKELKITRSKFSDELRSVSVISNIENISYDSSLTKEELEILGNDQKDVFVKKEFQKFGDDVHRICELMYDKSHTKDSICEQMTSIQGKLDFEKMFTSLKGNLESMCSRLNLDNEFFFPELKVTDGYNHGKFDLVVKNKDDKYIIIDYKTSRNLGINYKLQINMYRYMLKKVYDIETVNEYLIKIDKENYMFEIHEVPKIDEKFIIELLETGVLTEESRNECVKLYMNDEDNVQRVSIDVEKQKELLVNEVMDLDVKVQEVTSKLKEINSNKKNLEEEKANLVIQIEDRLNNIIGEVNLDTIEDELQIQGTNLVILKKDKATGNSPKFKEHVNNKEAIIAFCRENSDDFFNKVTDVRSLKSYIWKNFEELKVPKWTLNYTIETIEEEED